MATDRWTVEFLNRSVVEEFDSLPIDIRNRFQRNVELILEQGRSAFRNIDAKHISGPLWEMRLRGRSGISRALYVTVTGRRVVVVRLFVKKTRKTPKREIELALRRAKELDI